VDGTSLPASADGAPTTPEIAPAVDPHALAPPSPASEPATVDGALDAGKSDARGKPA
jgi:hypothetical protein